MLAKLLSVAKAAVGLLGVLIVIANQLLALGGVIPPKVALGLSAFVAVATPIAAYFAPYAPIKKAATRRAAKKAAPRKAV